MKTWMNLMMATLFQALGGPAAAQGGGMMNGGYGGMWGSAWMGGYGGLLVPLLLLAVVALVVWIFMQKRK